MARARYNTDLPSVHLTKEDVSELEQILKDCNGDFDIEIVLDTDQLIYEFSSVGEMYEDRTLPAFVQNFEIKAEGEQGEIRITSDPEDKEIELVVNGEQEWVKGRVRRIEEFFDRRGDRIRTLIEVHSFKGIIGIVGGGGLLIHYAGLGWLFGIDGFGDIVFYGFIALIVGAAGMNVLNYVHPYSLIILRSDEEFRPYVTRIITLLTVVAAIATLLVFALRLGLSP